MKKFINLRNHTHYTLQLGVGSVEDHVNAAIKNEQAGFALTDKMSLGGVIEAYKHCGKKNIPFVAGCMIHFIERRTSQNHEAPFSKLMVFAKNYQGYQNLCKILALASTPKYFYYKPRVDWDLLVQHKEGLIVTTGDYQSLFGKFIEDFTTEDEEWFAKFKHEFGEDFYAEICLQDVSLRWSKEQDTFIQETNSQVTYNQRILELAEKFNVKTYVSAPCYMPDASYHFVQTAMIRNSKGSNGWHFPHPLGSVSGTDLKSLKEKDHGYISDELLEEMMATTLEILDKCKGLRFDMKIHLPKIDHENHRVWNKQSANAKFKELQNYCRENDPNFYDLMEIANSPAEKSLKLTLLICLDLDKCDLKDPVYRERLLYEILTVERNGVVRLLDYFLTEEDVNEFVKSIGELRGFGRGSGASFLLNYLLDITDLDPIKYRLLPDRFISTDRIGDIFMILDTSEALPAKKTS